MSDVDEFDDDVDDTESKQSEGSALRKQNSKLAKQLEDLQKELNSLRTEKRTNVIAETLREKGANPKLAKYVSRDLEGDVTAESVAKWLEEEGELFGYAPQGEEPDDEQVAAERISASTTNARPSPTAWTPERIKSASVQELIDAGIIQP